MKALLSSDGVLEFETRTQIWLFDGVLVLLGLFLTSYSRWDPSMVDALRYALGNYPNTTLLVIACVSTVAFWFSAEVLFCFLNQRRTGDRAVFEQQVEGGTAGKGAAVGYQKDALLGYKPSPNVRLISKLTFKGRRIFEFSSSTDEHSRRITPVQTVGEIDKFILFFGCSFTFGEGVQNDETLPFFVGQLASRYQPYNYGVNGYGPQQMVAKLQRGEIRTEIKQSEGEGVLVYTFIDDHIHRAIGSQHVVTQNWGRYMPYYALNSKGDLERRGDFVSGRPGLALLFWLLGKSEIANYFRIGVHPMVADDDFRLVAQMFVESRNAFSRLFNSDKFFVLIFPGSVWGDRLIPHLQKNGVQYFDYSALFDPSQAGLSVTGDPHPTPKAYRIVAERLARDLGILDTRTQ